MSKARRKKIGNIKKIAQKYVKSLEKNDFPIHSAFLFGSYVRGNFRKDSDIDLAIISNKFRKNRDENEKFIWRHIINIDSRIEPVGFAPENFTSVDPLVYEIKKTGIRIK